MTESTTPLAELKKSLLIVENIGFLLTNRTQYTGREAAGVVEMLKWVDEFYMSLKGQVDSLEPAPVATEGSAQ